jgi:hypothetical protein
VACSLSASGFDQREKEAGLAFASAASHNLPTFMAADIKATANHDQFADRHIRSSFCETAD